METLLKIENLNAWYTKGDPVIKGLNLKLATNSVVGLLGLNGAGKTTLLNVLCGLHSEYEQDEATFEQKKFAYRDGKFKKDRYMVFSEDDSFGYFSFDEYLHYVFRTYGKKVDQAEVDLLVKRFGFDAHRQTMIKNLSMGNKRKAYLITGFALKPKLLLLDEPVNGLDFQSTEMLYEMITDYKQYGTVLFSSHVMESVTLTADEVVILKDGYIAKTFSNEEITAENIREYVS
ncbi:MAG: ABC transporter ATP-binding protein [Eubacteriales bacterium]|nr:ABC transporter ATP-binding protein [Eubacteriales bacterium]